MLDPLYWAISWILLQWHTVWHLVFRGSSFLGTDWEWVLAIVFLVLTIRGILFPVFVKQIKSQRAMQALQPKVKELQEKHKGDRESMQKELMELYRKEKANPLMGCLPMFLQIPVFLGLFHVLRRLGPFKAADKKTLYGWTIEQFDSASHAKLFTAPIAGKFGSTAEELARLEANGTTVKIIAGILVLAAAARLTGLGWGLPDIDARPDEDIMIAMALRFGTGDLNPHWFGYPTLYAYLLHGFFTKLMEYMGWYDRPFLHTLPGVAATAAAGAVLATLLCTPPVRKVMHWALEPDMSWAFVPLRRPERA